MTEVLIAVCRIHHHVIDYPIISAEIIIQKDLVSIRHRRNSWISSAYLYLLLNLLERLSSCVRTYTISTVYYYPALCVRRGSYRATKYASHNPFGIPAQLGRMGEVPKSQKCCS
jgi:hypothetical protein